STGQRQRVKLAQAIAADPSFVVLDEPTDGLDPVQRDEMLNIIVDINRTFGIDVMLSSHVLEEVERICDHVVALDAGRLVAQGTMTELAGASGGVEVELVDLDDVPDSIDAVERRLVADDVAVRRNGPILELSGHDDDELFDAVTAAVADSNARIRRLGVRRRTLDDVFTSDVVSAEYAGLAGDPIDEGGAR
ncbi:MAG: ATP-binding cassette domain-containing protein, partial [Actinomycetota bacterium]